jgi:mannosyltransferase OCH1-like enzyme
MNSIYNNIFQTHKSIKYINSKPKLRLSVKTWLQHKNKFNYFFYDDNNCEKFMKNIVGGDTYKAYQKLPINVMKADLWRYCVIYEYGGIYADIDTICKINPQIFLNDALLTIVPENECHLCQWVFAAPPKSPILKEVIELSVKRILNKEQIKGEHIIHELTGPGVFTDGIENYLKNNNLPTFKNRKLYYRYPHMSVLRVFNPDFFHKNIILHLFTGADFDGWCNERNKKLLK